MRTKLIDGDIMDSVLYIITLPLHMILFMVQLVIFLNFAIKTRAINISRVIRYFALMIGLIVLFTFSIELWSIIVDLSSTLPTQYSVYCFIQNYIRCISFIILESTLFIFWVIRLKFTFVGTILALSNKFIYFMFILIPFVTILLMIICIISIQPRYFKIDIAFNPTMNNIGYGCTTINNTGLLIFFIGAQCISIIFNLLFGYLFYHKLKIFITITHYNDKSSKLFILARGILMRKHTLLLLITVISTIIAYLLFDIVLYIFYDELQWQFAFLFIDIDMAIKTVTCLLMFKFYEKKFFKICCCCIRIAATLEYACTCDKNINDGISLFQPLIAVLIANVVTEEATYNDIYGEDRLLTLNDIHDLQLRSHDADRTIYGDHIPMTYILGDYTFHALLIKQKMNDNNVHGMFRIFQIAMRNENIDDEEVLFRKIHQQYDIYGHITYNNSNIFYYKNDECKLQFVVAIKIETEAIQDGNVISEYVSKCIADGLNKLSKIPSEYESLLETIIRNIRSHNIEIRQDSSRDSISQMDFSTKPYKMWNFIACLTSPQSSKYRFLDYSIKGYNVIASQIFNEIEMTNGSENNCMVIMNVFQFDQNK
eukprot:458214_1